MDLQRDQKGSSTGRLVRVSDDVREARRSGSVNDEVRRHYLYAAWRFRMWVAGCGSYADIDRAVSEGRMAPGCEPFRPMMEPMYGSDESPWISEHWERAQANKARRKNDRRIQQIEREMDALRRERDKLMALEALDDRRDS